MAARKRPRFPPHPAQRRRAACPHAAMAGVRCRKPRGSGGAARTRNARPYAGWNQRTQAQIGTRSGRAYSPPLRENPRRVRRGGLYGRPRKRPRFPPHPAQRRRAACPHAAMAGVRCRRARWFRRCGLAGCGHPALRRRPKAWRRGGLYGRPKTPAISTAPPPNAVGRHAHMPPWPGGVAGEPRGSGGAVWRGVGTPPYGEGRKPGVGAACMAARIAAPSKKPGASAPGWVRVSGYCNSS